MKEDKEYYSMITDTWKLLKKFLGQVKENAAVMKDDNWWQTLIDEGEQLSKKYGECEFIKALVVHNIFNEFDAIAKGYMGCGY